jgi:hypothetical protein
VIGHRDRIHPQFFAPRKQSLTRYRPIQKRILRMQMQMYEPLLRHNFLFLLLWVPCLSPTSRYFFGRHSFLAGLSCEALAKQIGEKPWFSLCHSGESRNPGYLLFTINYLLFYPFHHRRFAPQSQSRKPAPQNIVDIAGSLSVISGE